MRCASSRHILSILKCLYQRSPRASWKRVTGFSMLVLSVQNTNSLSKLDAQDEAAILDSIRNRLTLSSREVCWFPIPSPTKGPKEYRHTKQGQAERVMEKDLYPHVNLFSDWLRTLASLTKVKMQFRGTKMEATSFPRPKPRFPCVE